uniref:S8 family serine peptidase n=1 Tax=Sneathia sanguinegens TaxID=40543 RepID=UPI002889C2F2
MKKIKILSLLFFVGCIVSCSSASVESNNDIHQNIPNNDEHKVEDTVEQDDVIEDNITLKNIDSIKSKDNNVVNIFEWVNDYNNKDDVNPIKDVDLTIAGLKEKNIDKINEAGDNHAKRVLLTYLENNGASGNDYKLSKPVSDDVLGHVNLHKYFSYMDHNKHKGKKIYDAKGIINLSFGEESFPNVIHFVKNREMYVEDFGTTLFNGSTAITNWSKLANNIKGDFKNDRLVFKSLGNGGNTYWCSSYSQYTYTTLSPELQKIARNDMILVSNIVTPDVDWERSSENKVATINNKDYYIPEYNTSKAMLLRSLTMAAPGFKNRSFGSSYSAPFVARTAQMILKKYPYLTYNQVKQILFTTATSDKTYLNNVFGWGVLNQEKALKGPGALNGGLIEEEKY